MLECLLGIVTSALRKFENVKLTSTEIAEILQQLWAKVGEYLFVIERDSLGQNIFRQVAKVVKESSDYQANMRSIQEFESFFLQENYRFKPLFQEKPQETRTKYCRIAQGFLLTLLEEMKKRLPPLDSLVMKGDCILLKNGTDLENLREMAVNFSYAFDESENKNLELQISLIKEESRFLQKIQDAEGEKVIKLWMQLDQVKYQELQKLIRIMQLIPSSNANIERDFSQLNLIKTTIRNRMSVATIEACMLLKQENSESIEELYWGLTHNEDQEEAAKVITGNLQESVVTAAPLSGSNTQELGQMSEPKDLPESGTQPDDVVQSPSNQSLFQASVEKRSRTSPLDHHQLILRRTAKESDKTDRTASSAPYIRQNRQGSFEEAAFSLKGAESSQGSSNSPSRRSSSRARAIGKNDSQRQSLQLKKKPSIKVKISKTKTKD